VCSVNIFLPTFSALCMPAKKVKRGLVTVGNLNIDNVPGNLHIVPGDLKGHFTRLSMAC
jgi:hypothetical protein